MKENIFEMGSKFDDSWSSDNKTPKKTKNNDEIKEPSKHMLHFAKEKRRGKVITIVKPFYIESIEIKKVLKELKNRLATGGTINENSIEIQGDLQVKAKNVLEKLGYRFKGQIYDI